MISKKNTLLTTLTLTAMLTSNGYAESVLSPDDMPRSFSQVLKRDRTTPVLKQTTIASNEYANKKVKTLKSIMRTTKSAKKTNPVTFCDSVKVISFTNSVINRAMTSNYTKGFDYEIALDKEKTDITHTLLKWTQTKDEPNDMDLKKASIALMKEYEASAVELNNTANLLMEKIVDPKIYFNDREITKIDKEISKYKDSVGDYYVKAASTLLRGFGNFENSRNLQDAPKFKAKYFKLIVRAMHYYLYAAENASQHQDEESRFIFHQACEKFMKEAQSLIHLGEYQYCLKNKLQDFSEKLPKMMYRTYNVDPMIAAPWFLDNARGVPQCHELLRSLEEMMATLFKLTTT
jgi:hypothetical protein